MYGAAGRCEVQNGSEANRMNAVDARTIELGGRLHLWELLRPLVYRHAGPVTTEIAQQMDRSYGIKPHVRRSHVEATEVGRCDGAAVFPERGA